MQFYVLCLVLKTRMLITRYACGHRILIRVLWSALCLLCVSVFVCVYKTEQKDGMRGGDTHSPVLFLFAIELIKSMFITKLTKKANYIVQ